MGRVAMRLDRLHDAASQLTAEFVRTNQPVPVVVRWANRDGSDRTVHDSNAEFALVNGRPTMRIVDEQFAGAYAFPHEGVQYFDIREAGRALNAVVGAGSTRWPRK